MKDMITVFALMSFGTMICGCNSDVTASSSSENLNYRLSEDGCDTGNQKFSSKEDYCHGLENDAKNYYCALDLRRDLYQQRCNGRFQNSNTRGQGPSAS